MKAIEIREYGGPENLAVTEVEKPAPKNGEVLVKVAGIGLNRADMLQRIGKYPPPPGASHLMGLEVSGVIEETGEKICALLPGGGYAEYVAVPRELCLPVPDNIDLVEAAGLPEAMFTVAKNVFAIGQLRTHEHLLVHGGASGIGTMAIQMAKALAIKVSVTAGSDERCKQCVALGADTAINYKTADYADVLKDDGPDVVLDMVGGDYIPRDLQIMKQGGRHVSIAYLNAAKAEISIPLIMQKNLTVTGSTLRGDTAHHKQTLAHYLHEIFWPHLETGRIKPVIDRVFPFEQAAQAHTTFEQGGHFGKILLRI